MFYNNISERPTLQQRKDLLARIVTIPDAGWYTLQHVTSWFAVKNGCSRAGSGKERLQGGKDKDKDKDSAKLSTNSIRMSSLPLLVRVQY